MEVFETDAVVVGAGVIGLAIARELARAGKDVLVLERQADFGTETSSRNSEVIHAGLYYPEDSLKAALCIRGRQLLYRYCESHDVGAQRTGKWIVAVSPSQEAQLSRIEKRAGTLGVPLQSVGQGRLKTMLPAVTGCSALFSPETGIIDSHQLMQALIADTQAAGGQLVYHAPVDGIESRGGEHCLSVGGAMPCRLRARWVVNAAGLDAVGLMRRWSGFPRECVPQAFFARGSYFSYSGRHPFDSLIYPVPETGGLGVHLTLDMAGQIRFGPDVEWIERPSYEFDESRKSRFVDAIRQWWPDVDAERLQPAYTGIRPKLAGPSDGFRDFRIDGPESHGVEGVVQLAGIESPGLTSCLAIAEFVRQRLESGSSGSTQDL